MKTIRKNFLLLAFAAGALFLIGNNVMADDPTTPGHEPPGGGGDISITCHAMWKWGRKNRCFLQGRDDVGRLICYWTGKNSDICDMP